MGEGVPLKLLWTNAMRPHVYVEYFLKSKKKTTHRKRSDLWLLEWGIEGGELEEGGPRVQRSSYKINKSWRCNVQHYDYSRHPSVV